jgi:hypothetical protein
MNINYEGKMVNINGFIINVAVGVAVLGIGIYSIYYLVKK